MNIYRVLKEIDDDKLTWKQYTSLLIVAALVHWILALVFVNGLASQSIEGPWPSVATSYRYLVIIDYTPEVHPDRPGANIAETHYCYTERFSVSVAGTITIENPEVIVKRRIMPGRLSIVSAPTKHTAPLVLALPEAMAVLTLIEHPSRHWNRIPTDPIPKQFTNEPFR